MAIAELYNSENFKEFMAKVEEIRNDAMDKLKTSENSSMIFRAQGAVTVLDAVLTLPADMDAEDEALKEDEEVEPLDYP